jgi:hypothetical protein
MINVKGTIRALKKLVFAVCIACKVGVVRHNGRRGFVGGVRLGKLRERKRSVYWDRSNINTTDII